MAEKKQQNNTLHLAVLKQMLTLATSDLDWSQRLPGTVQFRS